MRRPSRNIEIFSMSVLDMFASALGAFIMIAVILFPYYDKSKLLQNLEKEIATTRQSIETVQSTINRQQKLLEMQSRTIASLGDIRRDNAQCEAKKKTCLAALSTTFLVVGMEWDESYDVDLIVKDPAGVEFRYDARYGSGNSAPSSGSQQPKAFLSLDMLSGPGTEIWQTANALVGRYTVSIRSQSLDEGEEINARTWIIDRTSSKTMLGSKRIVQARATVRIATIDIAADGSVNIDSFVTGGP